MSGDGYVAGLNGEADWIGTDREVDFTALWAQFDTLLMGRRTRDWVRRRSKESLPSSSRRHLKQQDHPEVTVVSELNPDWVQALRTRSGKDIWLFGGSALFLSFLDAGHVDTVEVSVIPVLLGGGIPLLHPAYNPARLRLLSHKVYRSGRVSLAYDVQQ